MLFHLMNVYLVLISFFTYSYTTGLGKAIVKKFCLANAIVFALDKDEAALSKLKYEFPDVNTLVVDLIDWNSSKAAVEKILPIHHLVNNAGILREPVDFLKSTSEDIDL